MTATADILLIEDGVVMREALGEWLEAAGYAVRRAEDGNAGLEALRASVPALVITDIHLPGANGATVISEMRRSHPEVPVIAISRLFNSGHGLDATSAITLGAARALAKPFRRRDLLKAVSELLDSRAG